MSWIEDEEKLLKVQDKFQREPMESIKCFFLFMNQNKYIEKITDEILDLNLNPDPDLGLNSHAKISKERVLKLIEEKKSVKPDVKYAFLDSWLFLVDLEPEHIQAFSQTEVSSRFITKLSFVDDIVIVPSIFIFHDMNAVYFLFQEMERTPAKSALRNKVTGHKATKRVTYSAQFNKTRKNISIT
jgi:hypothetical protein